jgi:hypothetical protein
VKIVRDGGILEPGTGPSISGFFSCLAPGHLATHVILALIINRRYYLDARTAFVYIIIYWHQDGDINFICNV